MFSYQARESILIAPIGFTKNYLNVRYAHPDNDSYISDWLSFMPLIKYLFGDSSNELAIILIYPDNPGAITSIEKGWPENDRPSVMSRLDGFSSIITITVSDRSSLSENDLWSVLQKLHKNILSLQSNGRKSVIFDLTHSYRHLSFAGFIEALFLSDLLNNLRVCEVFYALARQPLEPNDVVTYVKLNRFSDLIKRIGSIKKAVNNLDPNIITELSNQIDNSNNSLKKFKFWLQDLSNILFILQIGFVQENIFNQIMILLDDHYFDVDYFQDSFDYKLIYDELKLQLFNFIDLFKSSDGQYRPYYECQIILGEHIFKNQLNVMVAYSYLREGLISFLLFLAEGITNGGSKNERSITEDILSRYSFKGKNKEKRKMLIDFAEFTITNIGNKRNMYAHVMAGRENFDNIKKYHKNKKKTLEEDIQKTKEKIQFFNINSSQIKKDYLDAKSWKEELEN